MTLHRGNYVISACYREEAQPPLNPIHATMKPYHLAPLIGSLLTFSTPAVAQNAGPPVDASAAPPRAHRTKRRQQRYDGASSSLPARREVAAAGKQCSLFLDPFLVFR
jgi:hypothetical protein